MRKFIMKKTSSQMLNVSSCFQLALSSIFEDVFLCFAYCRHSSAPTAKLFP